MTDEPTPRMPRRVEKRKPEPKPKLRKKDLSHADAIEAAEALLSVDERACAHLAAEYSIEHAAMTLNWPIEAITQTLALPQVRLYLRKVDEAFLKEIAKAKVRKMIKVGISQANVEQRLMDLAQLDPADTKGNIDGQVKALRTLAEILGMLNENDPLKGKTREELEGFVQTAARLLPAKTDSPVN